MDADKTISLSDIESQIVRVFLTAEYKAAMDRIKHAHSHGDTHYQEPDNVHLSRILDKLNRA